MAVRCFAAYKKVENFVTEKAGSGHGKMKTGFQCVYHTWEKRKNTRHIFQNMSDLLKVMLPKIVGDISLNKGK